MELLEKRLKVVGCDYLLNEPMSRHTTFKIGGPAKIFITPKNEQQAAAAIEACRELEKEFFVLGNGSNLLVSDNGFSGAVISLSQKMCGMSREENCITAQAGENLASVCRFAANEGLGGLEFAFGIPGSIGGAVYMNAGAYGGELKDAVVSVRALFPDGEIRDIPAKQADFGYRHSAFEQNGAVILSAKFSLTPDKSGDIEARMRDIIERRRQKQPLEWPSAGSAFKRPENGFAAAMIDECGLKGYTIGGAQVSEKHAGFIINRGGATCEDVKALLEHVRETVYGKTGVMLQPEIKQLG